MFPRISIGGSNVNMTLLLCMISVNFLFSNSFKWQFKGEKLKKEKKFLSVDLRRCPDGRAFGPLCTSFTAFWLCGVLSRVC